jgi:hypothetical protein
MLEKLRNIGIIAHIDAQMTSLRTTVDQPLLPTLLPMLMPAATFPPSVCAGTRKPAGAHSPCGAG